MSKILVTGSSNGLGAELVKQLREAGHQVFGWDHGLSVDMDVRKPNVRRIPPELDVLINCAGVNRINWLQNVPEAEWDLVMDTNVKGMFMMTQACLPQLLASGGTVVNIVSNAAHQPMRSSAAYNASKGAALILTKQLARELTSQGVTVFSVSPNKMAGTGMSNDIDEQVMKVRGWTREKAQEYQLAGLLTGEETPVERVAEFITFLLQDKEHHKYLSGVDLPYGL